MSSFTTEDALRLARKEVLRCQRNLDNGGSVDFWRNRLEFAAKQLEASAVILRMHLAAMGGKEGGTTEGQEDPRYPPVLRRNSGLLSECKCRACGKWSTFGAIRGTAPPYWFVCPECCAEESRKESSDG